VGILAFEEVKGIFFESDSAALEQSEKKKTISLFRVYWVVDSPSENRLIWCGFP
jgi:hypothetical protein